MNDDLKRVLFVCVGNACRSQMAEAFAHAYGRDVLVAASAGLSPAARVAPQTILAMAEKNLDLRDHFPKTIRHLARARFDLVVNMSGVPIADRVHAPVRDWDVDDPVSMAYDDHCAVRDRIESLVVQLVLELRRDLTPPRRGQASGRLEP